MKDAKFSVGIIGAGNVGSHLTRLFLNAGIDVVICSSQKELLNIPELSSEKIIQDLSEFSEYTDFIFFTRRDRDLNLVLPALSKRHKMIHCSGSMDMNVFSEFDSYGVFYPLQTFRKEHHLLNSDFPVFIEASDKDTLHVLKKLAGMITPKVFEADFETRRHLHLAGVLSSNFVNSLYAAAYEQIPDKYDAAEVLLPLMKETLSRLDSGHPDEFQTGPAIRKDEETINKHLAMLSNHPDLQALYRSMSEIIKKRHS
ncbi:MAG: hypothetical protein C0592_10655 [Marinilabiliales bacterium]|nr:MAG: hypothetical protein C0592_10655 [Marinilabiliales bacterium]